MTSGGRKVWGCATPSCSPIHCLRSRHCPRNLHQAGPCRKFTFIRERIRRSEQLPVERQVTDPLLPSTSHESSGRIGRSAVARPALSKVLSWWTAVNQILYVMQREMFLAVDFLIAKSPSQVRHSHETPQPRLPILRSCARKSNTPPQKWGKPHVHRHISDASASPLTSLGGE